MASKNISILWEQRNVTAKLNTDVLDKGIVKTSVYVAYINSVYNMYIDTLCPVSDKRPVVVAVTFRRSRSPTLASACSAVLLNDSKALLKKSPSELRKAASFLGSWPATRSSTTTTATFMVGSSGKIRGFLIFWFKIIQKGGNYILRSSVHDSIYRYLPPHTQVKRLASEIMRIHL